MWWEDTDFKKFWAEKENDDPLVEPEKALHWQFRDFWKDIMGGGEKVRCI